MRLRQDRDTHLRAWALSAPRKQSGMTVKVEIKRLSDALDHEDQDVLAKYGEWNEGLRQLGKLKKLPEPQAAKSVSLDGFSTCRASRFAVIENGFESREEDS